MVVELSSLVVKLGVARYRARWAYMRLKSGCITNRKQIFMVEYTKEIRPRRKYMSSLSKG
jgi:hypothetical protein